MADCWKWMWVAEVQSSHAARLADILANSGVKCSIKNHDVSGLLCTNINLASTNLIPIECLKYITRIFFVPHSCRDLEWCRTHNDVQTLINDNSLIRVQGIPKAMEMHIAEALIGDESTCITVIPRINPCNIRASNYTHIFQCIYDADTGIYHWGITDAHSSISNNMTHSALGKAVSSFRNIHCITPICRAFFKIQEMIEHYFPLWNWKLPEDLRSVDIGASPGGWTQYLARCKPNAEVLACDPGELDPSLLQQHSNIQYVQAVAQSTQTTEALIKFGGFDLCVCDVNFEAKIAAEVLADYVLKYASADCGIRPNKYSNTPGVTDTHKINISVSALSLPLGRESVATRDEKNKELSLLTTACTHSEYYHQKFSYLILTLKLPKNPKEKHLRMAVSSIIQTLSGNNGRKLCSWDYKVVHLNANSQNERTVACKFHNL